MKKNGLVLLWLTLSFTQGHRLQQQKSENLCNHSVVKWYEVAQLFVVFDYVREMIAKSI